MQSPSLHGFRLSHQQRRWWLLHRDGAVHRALCAVEITGELDHGRLRSSLAGLVERHQILRTSFQRRAGLALPFQVIADLPCPPAWEEIDLSGGSAREREDRFQAVWQAAGQEPDSASPGSALRARLIRFEPGRHRLILSLPALCADARTLSLLAGGIALAAEPPRAADEEPVQYVQVSEWQHETVEDEEEAAEGKAFWRDREAAAAEPLHLPWQRDAAAVGLPAEPLRIGVTLGDGTTAGLSRLAAESSGSLEAALLTAWAALLGRLTGREDLALAVETDGRGLEELAGALGPLARAVPVRLGIDPEKSFAAALTGVAAALREAVDWQQHWLPDPQGDRTSRDVGFAFEPLPPPRSAGGVELRMTRCEVPGDLRPLALRCTAVEGRVTAVLEADPERFDAAGAAKLAEGFRVLVESAAQRPASLLEALPVLPAEERERLLHGFNATASPVPEPLLVHRRFELQAERHPEREALRFEAVSLTYAELNARANRLARHFRGLGVGPETVVALWLPRSPDLVVALLAVLKAGGGYLPVDVTQPAERLARMLVDSGAALLVTQGGAGVPPVAGLRGVDLDFDAAAVAALGDGDLDDLDFAVEPDGLAYVIFTSGSTGRPKGVAVPHRQLASYVHGLGERLGLGSGASFATVSTFAADLGNTSLFGALCGGGCLHVLAEERIFDGEAMAAYLESHGVDVLKIVPSHFQALYRTCPRPERLLPRRCLVLGGEACPSGLVSQLLREAPHLDVLNHYGPTETTVGVCAHRPERSGEPAAVTVPIGRPLANARLYVLDERLEPLPAGVPGELFIGGAGVARGYLGQGAQTAERFLPDPFAGSPGARMYRTGDRARHLPGGALECLGRLDRQVKIRGFRVEPDEVALALREHPGVEAAVAVPFEEAGGGVRLAAYTVPRRLWAAEIDGRKRFVLPNGMAIAHQNRNETEYLFQEIFVRHTYAQHGVRLREEAVVLDLGANIGMFMMFVAACRPRARLYSFEPLPPLFRTLRLNAELYAPGAKVFPAGVAETERTAEFMFYPQHTMMSGLSDYADPELERRVVERSLRNAGQQGSAEAAALIEHADELLGRRFEGERHACRLLRLSDVIRQEGLERIDLLKIDVQRAELDVLRGLEEPDWHRIDQIVMELHQDEAGATAGRIQQVLDLLGAHGFEAVVEQDPMLVGTDRYALYARRRDGRVEGEDLAALATTAAAPENRVLDAAQLRAWLSRRLPEPMCPAQHVLVKALPLTRNGKVDLRALPAPEQAGAAEGEGHVAPRNPVEERIAAIWAEVLGLERVGVHDNYFEIGGDSMQSIRVIARAARVGLRLTAQHFFEHQTIALLAAVLGDSERAAGEPAGLEIPLTPAQRRFLEGPEDPRAWGLPLPLEARGAVDRERLALAFREVAARHDALRLRFVRDAAGWRQRYGGEAAAALEWLDLSGVDPAALEESCDAVAVRLRAGLDLRDGPVARLACLDFGTGRPARLLLVCHPLVADEPSWRILVEDLGAAYRALEQGRDVSLPPATRPFRGWAEGVAALADAPEARSEAAFWLDGRYPGAGAEASPAPAGGEGLASPVTVRLDCGETQALVRDLAGGSRAEVEEVLLLALTEALGERWHGAPLVFDLESDARRAGLGDLDVSRTVGCFTSVSPRRLHLEPSSAGTGDRLRAVKEQLRAAPRQGISFGALRDLASGGATAAALRGLAEARLAFRYLGDLDEWAGGASPFALVPGTRALELLRRSSSPRPHRIGVHAWIADGRLHAAWTPGPSAAPGEAEELADGFVSLLRALLSAGGDAGAASPTDFPLAGLGQEDLQRIASLFGRAEE